MVVPKYIQIFFFMLCYVFGMDLGYSKNMSLMIQYTTKLANTVISGIVFLILITPLVDVESMDFPWFVIAFLEFIGAYIISKVTKYTVNDFLIDMHNIDESITKINKMKIGVLIWAYFMLWYLIMMVVDYVDCEIIFPGTCVIDYIPYTIYNLLSNGSDSVFLVPILIYGYFYYCLKDVYQSFKYDSNLSLLTKRFDTIATCYAKIRPLYEKLIILELLEIPKMMGLIYTMLKYMKDEEELIAWVGEIIYAGHIVSNIICTGAMGQMVVDQVDDIKIQLHGMLLTENDKNRVMEINRILGYIEARQLWRPVAGVIPVDMRLATTALSVFATYMIVLIQLTHIV